MPTYDYQCGKCGFEFEREQRITEDAIRTCPECKSRQAKRLLSAPNFILKGGGWYADGYGSSGKGGAKKSDSSEGDSDGTGGPSKGASKKESSSSSSSESGSQSSDGDAKSSPQSSGESSSKSSSKAKKSAA
jgi:putative FmdB family regulatory protein